MRETTGSYVSPGSGGFFRAQAFRAWAVTGAIVTAWLIAIILPAVAPEAAGRPLYLFFSYVCHQLPERSLHFDGHSLAVCSRCFGVYFGLFAGVVAYPLFRRVEDIEPLARVWLFLSLIPIGIDWSLTVFGVWENTHLSRFVTGTILGVACAVYIVPAVVEIRRNISLRRRPAM